MLRMSISLILAAATLPSMVQAEPRGLDARDLVSLERVSDPNLSPDGRTLVYSVRETDLAGNRGINGLWRLDLSREGATPSRITPEGESWSSPRFGGDGRLYAMHAGSGSHQVWRLAADGSREQVTAYPLSVGSYGISRDGTRLAVSMAVYTDCADLACSVQRREAEAQNKASGRVYDSLYVRHWDTWKDGTRNQLFVAELGQDGKAGSPVWVSRGVEGDVPHKPFGGDGDFTFGGDGKHVYFVANHVAGTLEAISTNLDLWRAPVDGSAAPVNLTADNPAVDHAPVVSPDGRFLAWLAMTRPMYESDRQRILVRNLASGTIREVAADWDRSPGSLAFSPDGGHLFVTANDLGQNRLFAIDLSNDKVERRTDLGQVAGVAVGDAGVVYVHNDLKSPGDLFVQPLAGGQARALTRLNRARMADVELGDFEQFTFAGWNDETVYGHVVKPWNYREGDRYPVAFIIHGGPQGSMGNSWHYRWNAQTYAGAGFGVVFIDFHASTGYGQAFTDSIREDWGGKPLVDLQKGLAHALASYDWLDGGRVCALGASYGGFMINWIAGQWNEPFRCLVNHSGILDNRSMYYSTEELFFTEWEHGAKPYHDDPQAYERFNPVHHIDKWRAPMLVIHGDLDFRVPLEQGIATFTALQRRGIASRFLRFPDENHWILKPANSILWHDTVNEWLRQWTVKSDP